MARPSVGCTSRRFHRALCALLCVFPLALGPRLAWGQDDVSLALGYARGLVHGALRAPVDQRAVAAELEAQLGLDFYVQGEDWRAISALLRYEALATSPQASFTSQLLVGQIYHRNARHLWAARAFALAAQSAPDPEQALWARLLWLQEQCVGLERWVACDHIIGELLPQAAGGGMAGQVVGLERLYLDVVFRRPLSLEPEAFESATMQAAARGLKRHDAAFEGLELRRPWLAASLSALLPGAGQVYNGRWGDGVLALGLNAAMGGATYYSFAKLESVPLGVVSALFWSGFYIGNIVNAHTDALRLNEVAYQAYFTQMQAFWPRVSVSVERGQVGFGVAFDWPGFAPPAEESAPKKMEDRFF